MKMNLKTVLVLLVSVAMLSACGKANKKTSIGKPSEKPNPVTPLEAEQVEADFAAPSKVAAKLAEQGVFLILEEDGMPSAEQPLLVKTTEDQVEAAEKAVADMGAALEKISRSYAKPFLVKKGDKTFQKKLGSELVASLKAFTDALATAAAKLEKAKAGEVDEGDPLSAEQIQEMQAAIAEVISVDGLVEVKPDEGASFVGTAQRGPGGGDPPVVGGGG